mgnify:CR=1 FL=1
MLETELYAYVRLLSVPSTSLLTSQPLTAHFLTFHIPTFNSYFYKKMKSFSHTLASLPHTAIHTSNYYCTLHHNLHIAFPFPLSAFALAAFGSPTIHHSFHSITHYQSIVQYSTQTQNNYHRINAESKLKHHSHNTSGLPQHCDCECDCDL